MSGILNPHKSIVRMPQRLFYLLENVYDNLKSTYSKCIQFLVRISSNRRDIFITFIGVGSERRFGFNLAWFEVYFQFCLFLFSTRNETWSVWWFGCRGWHQWFRVCSLPFLLSRRNVRLMRGNLWMFESEFFMTRIKKLLYPVMTSIVCQFYPFWTLYW